MKRLHLFEIEDQPWCPGIIRQGVTDFLQTISDMTGVYDFLLPMILKLAAQTNQNRFIDLCSGAGGPWFKWVQAGKIDLPLEIHITDFFPQNAEENVKMGNITIYKHSKPVSALAVPSDLNGIRTLFSSFHHFQPDQAKQIIKDAVDQKVPIAIFENTTRHTFWFLYCLALPLLVLFVTPWMKSLSLPKLFFTYVIPLIPLVVCFDGIVSGLRTYSVDELKELTKEFDSYTFQIGFKKLGFLPLGITYLIGRSKN